MGLFGPKFQLERYPDRKHWYYYNNLSFYCCTKGDFLFLPCTGERIFKKYGLFDASQIEKLLANDIKKYENKFGNAKTLDDWYLFSTWIYFANTFFDEDKISENNLTYEYFEKIGKKRVLDSIRIANRHFKAEYVYSSYDEEFIFNRNLTFSVPYPIGSSSRYLYRIDSDDVTNYDIGKTNRKEIDETIFISYHNFSEEDIINWIHFRVAVIYELVFHNRLIQQKDFLMDDSIKDELKQYGEKEPEDIFYLVNELIDKEDFELREMDTISSWPIFKQITGMDMSEREWICSRLSNF